MIRLDLLRRNTVWKMYSMVAGKLVRLGFEKPVKMTRALPMTVQ